jgi:hypothetical protein
MWELIYSKKIEDDVSRARLVLNKSISFYGSMQNPGNDGRISINNKSGRVTCLLNVCKKDK